MSTAMAGLPESKLTRKQVKTFGPVKFTEDERNYQIVANARYDDDCNNGHNSFALTADIHLCDVRGNPVRLDSCGCCHEQIVQHFPDLAPLVKWHLCSSDGPMHYPGNVLYMAGERDCRGRLKGEPCNFETHITFGNNPIRHKFGKKFTAFLQEAKAHPGSEPFDFEVIQIDHDHREGEHKYSPKFTFGGFDAKWYECPFDTQDEALNFLTALQTCDPHFMSAPTAWGEGKARELDSARHCAIWPEATDEELTDPNLKEKLIARLPGLMADFRQAVESLGFTY